MRKFSNENFQAICAILISIAALIVCWEVALPAYAKNISDRDKYQADFEAAKLKLTSVSTNANKLSASGASEVVDQLKIAIPTDKDLPNLITELEAIAKNEGMFIPAPSIADGADNTVTISFGISGTLEEIESFMTTIQKDLRFFNIKTINMSVAKDIINMSLSIEAYKRTSTAVVK